MSRVAPSCAAAQLRGAELASLRPRPPSAVPRRSSKPPPPRALHRHVAGWLQKPAPEPQQPPPGPSDAPQTPPAASLPPSGRPLERALRLIRPLFKAPLVSYENGCAGIDPAEARPSRRRRAPSSHAPSERKAEACSFPFRRQVLALWEATGIAPRGATAERVATALLHSFSCAAAYAATEVPPPPPDANANALPPTPRRVLVGFARTVSVRSCAVC